MERHTGRIIVDLRQATVLEIAAADVCEFGRRRCPDLRRRTLRNRFDEDIGPFEHLRAANMPEQRGADRARHDRIGRDTEGLELGCQ